MISHQTSVSKLMPPEIVNFPDVYNAPDMTVTRALSFILVCTCMYVCLSVHSYVRTSHQRRPLSKLNGFDQYVMKVNTLYITIITSSSMIIVYFAPCLQELWPFVHENSQFVMV